MNTLCSFLLIASLHTPGELVRHADAAEVAQWDFGEGTDLNFDDWPDGWTRRAGLDYPRYLKIAIRQEASASWDRCLRIDLDGGAAAVYSPPIAVGRQFSYVLEASLRTEQLVRDVAYISLTFYDHDQKPLESYVSQQHQAAPEWRKIAIGPVAPADERVSQAVIGLHLEPRDPKHPDLRGAALFDDIWLGRLPRMALKTDCSHNVYTRPDDIQVRCDVSGIPEREPSMTFELIDVRGERLAMLDDRLHGEAVSARPSPTPGQRAESDNTPDPAEHGYAGTMTWKPPITDYGYYRVRVTMSGATGLMQRREMSLAVIRPTSGPSRGEFGWSLPQGDRPLALGPLADLLGEAGVGWVKFPVWYSESQVEWGDQLARFIERLNGQGIEVVGMLDHPPDDVVDKFAATDQLLAATIFAEPELWHPLLNPIMTRLSLKVRWWQLGSDTDTSFIGHPDLSGKIREVKEQLERFGQEINLGIGWKWLRQPPAADRSDTPFVFLSYTADPPLTNTELAEFLTRTDTPGVARWAILQPLSEDEYGIHDRARDLVGRMLAAKQAGADCVFVPAPFDPQRGLMKPDGTPGELLLPWRTTSTIISGKRYEGSLVLPNGSHNVVFSDGREAVMVVWNEQPTQETLYLGDKVEQVDLWGKGVRPKQDGHRQVIEASPLPTFITGVHLPVARWRISFQFDKQQLSSVFGRPQDAAFALKNSFEHGVGGTVTLVPPDTWEVDAPTRQFRLAGHEELQQPIRIELRPNASSGERNVRVDFELTADKNYRFSVYRKMTVGLGDVLVDLRTRLNDTGDLVVEQRLDNRSGDFVSFNCFLFVPQRRHLRRQVIDQPHGQNVQTYVLSNGSELIGQTLWLRAEELGGDRVLSHRLTVQP